MSSNYFDEQIAQGKPIVPPTAQQAPSIVQGQNSAQTTQEEFVGLPVRASGDRVFLLKSGKRFWITSPEALEKLGFTFADVKRIDEVTLNALAEGEPIRE